MRAVVALVAGITIAGCATPAPQSSPRAAPALAAGDQPVNLPGGKQLVPLSDEERQEVMTMAR